MKRVLVLGSTGHIGAHVVRAFHSHGYAVRAAYRNPRYLFVLDGLPVDRVRCDLDDPAALASAIDGCGVVVHCGGYYPKFFDRRAPALERAREQITRTFDVVAAARVAKIVYVSSAATMTPHADRLSTESDQETWPLRAWRPLYPSVKIFMEHEVLRFAAEGLPVVIVNPSVCLGEWDAHAFSGRLVLATARWRLPACIDHHVSAVYTGDVGEGCVAAAERGTVGERYILSTRRISMLEIFRIINDVTGDRAGHLAHRQSIGGVGEGSAGGRSPTARRAPQWTIPSSMIAAAGGAVEAAAWLTGREPWFSRRAFQYAQRHRGVDGGRAQRELGVPQTSIEEAVRRTLCWFRANGYLRR